MVEKLTASETDVLVEIANIASGNASNILSNKIGRIVRLSIPDQRICPLKELPRLLEKTVQISPQEIAICTFGSLKGDILGNIITVFSRTNAYLLADLLQKKKVGTTKWLSVEDQKAILSLNNSLLKCYFGAMHDFLNLDLDLGQVKIFSTIGQALLELIYLAKPQGPILLLATKFSPTSPFEGRLMFIFFIPTQGVVSLLRKANLLIERAEKQ